MQRCWLKLLEHCLSTHVVAMRALALKSLAAVQAFAADLERLYTGFSTLDAEVLVAAGRGGQAAAASLNLDDAQINRLLLQVSAL